jgi:diadenosine tetraphosphatase ApaH/serine/threonine PP2A family protein phosphatase
LVVTSTIIAGFGALTFISSVLVGAYSFAPSPWVQDFLDSFLYTSPLTKRKTHEESDKEATLLWEAKKRATRKGAALAAEKDWDWHRQQHEGFHQEFHEDRLVHDAIMYEHAVYSQSVSPPAPQRSNEIQEDRPLAIWDDTFDEAETGDLISRRSAAVNDSHLLYPLPAQNDSYSHTSLGQDSLLSLNMQADSNPRQPWSSKGFAMPFAQRPSSAPVLPTSQPLTIAAGTVTNPPPGQPAESQPANEYGPGDHIEVWNEYMETWCPGIVERLDGPMVIAKFRVPNGNYLTKAVPAGHAKRASREQAQQAPNLGMRSEPPPNYLWTPKGRHYQKAPQHQKVPQSPRPRGPASPRPHVPASPHPRVPASPRPGVPASLPRQATVLVDIEEDVVDPGRKKRKVRRLSAGALHGDLAGHLSLTDHIDTRGAGEVVQFKMQRHASSLANEIVHEAMLMARVVNREPHDVLDRDWQGPNGQNPLLTLFRTGRKTLPMQRLAYVANAFERLAGEVQQILAHQPSLVRAQVPCKVFGDVHGQFRDLLLMLHNYGFPSSEKRPSYIFNGDWADRGAHQLEVICLVFSMKALFPEKVWLVRGNHEDSAQNHNMGIRGLEAECHTKLGQYGGRVFQAIHNAFNWLPLGCLVQQRILCVHGGIGDGNWSLQHLENLPGPVARPMDHDKIAKDKVVYNVLWSDPIPDDGDTRSDIFGVHDSPRDNHANMIVTFGKDVTEWFCRRNRLDMIIRSHQALVRGFGYDVMHGGKLVRVFSARDYEGGGHNDGCLLHIDEKHGHLVVRPQVIRSCKRSHGLKRSTSAEERRFAQQRMLSPRR